MADFYGSSNGSKLWKGAENAVPGLPSVNNAPAQMASPSPYTQPVSPMPMQGAVQYIQPFVVVPYSTQQQPLYMYGDGSEAVAYGEGMEGMYGYNQGVEGMDYSADGYVAEEDGSAKKKKAKREKGVNKLSLLLIILSLLVLFAICAGEFIKLEQLLFYNEKSGLGLIMLLPDVISGTITEMKDLLVICGMTGLAVMSALVLVLSLISIKKEKVSKLIKLLLILDIVCAVVAVVGILLRS